MAKIITHRYAAKCRVCKGEIPAGSRAYWLGKKQGSRHVECQHPKSDAKGNPPKETVYLWSDIRRDFLACSNGRNADVIFNRPENIDYWNDLAQARESEGNWTGATIAETRNWIENGYSVPGLDGVDSTLIQGAPKRKMRYSEEGDEMLIDLAWSGVDEHFITWDKRFTKPTIKVEINIAFSAIVSHSTVNAYQGWIARMLQTIDQFGFDTQVDLKTNGSRMFVGHPSHHNSVLIRVKESGTQADFSSWSPMFSPAGYRHLMFHCMIRAADDAGLDVARGLGAVEKSNAWDLKYDPETQTLVVSNNNDWSEFPEFDMTQKFIAIMQGMHS